MCVSSSSFFSSFCVQFKGVSCSCTVRYSFGGTMEELKKKGDREKEGKNTQTKKVTLHGVSSCR